MKRILTFIICIFFCFPTLNGQRVTVSKEISTRSDYAYDILGQFEDRVLLYRDKGNEKVVEVFDPNLKFLYDRELQLGERKSQVYGINKRTEDFTLFSGYKRKGAYSLFAHRFNKDVQPVDTSVIIDQDKDHKFKSFIFETSKDNSKTVLLTTTSEDLVHVFIVDSDSLELIWWKEILVTDFDVERDFIHAFVTNEGEVNILYYDDGKESEKGEAQFLLVGCSASLDVYANKFLVDKKYIIDIECKYDDKNRNVVLAGLASDDREYDADSYFFFNQNITQLVEENTISFRNFDANFIEEVYGKKLGKGKQLNDFITRDVIVRNDGGIVLVTEMEKEFYRRSSFNSISRNSDSYGRGWVDIYNEDIILISINSDGSEDWKKILYKKQFSQDDQGVFSSFFVFKNPSRLRIIYNDEIKQNITVSEYVVDPLGRYERNSLLSTEYQKLKLRWKDAFQISPSILIVPSENNYKLSLVKVDYGEKS